MREVERVTEEMLGPRPARNVESTRASTGSLGRSEELQVRVKDGEYHLCGS